MLRPFSNTQETLLTGAVLMILLRGGVNDGVGGHKMVVDKWRWLAAGAVCGWGCFVRITFPAYAGPPVLAALWWNTRVYVFILTLLFV